MSDAFGRRWASAGKRRRFVLLIAGMIASEPSLQARAQEIDPFALSPEQLFDATVVSVSRTSEKLRDAPAAVYVLTNEDIARSGATSIPEALRLVPGVQAARVNSAGWAISVRGFNGPLTNKLLVLIDGREVYDPLFSGVYWDVQDTALEDIDRIEVIRGPGASLWGANAVNGVINIITKSAADTQGALVSGIVGSQDHTILTARFGGDAGNKFHWRVYGKYSDRGPFDTLAGADAQDEWKAARGGFRADWQASAVDSFTLQGDLYRSDEGQFRSVPSLTAPYASVQHEDISADGANLLGRWSRALGDDSRLTVQSYVDYTTRRQLTLEDHRSTVDIDSQYELPTLDTHKVTLGIGYRYSADSLTATPIITFAEATRGDQRFSGFVQDKITLDPEHLFLTLGSKFEHNDYTGFEIQPTGRLQWQDNAQVIWGAISRAVRTPSRLENDLNVLTGVIPPGGALPLPVAVELTPSPNFDSEKLIAYELGYRRQWSDSVIMDVAVFYNDYDSLSTLSLLPPLVAFNPLHLILPIGITNLTTAKTDGVEAVFNWRAREHLNFSAAYSFVEMQLDGPPSNQAIAAEAAERQSPRNQFTLRSQWDVRSDLSFDTTLYYVDAIGGYVVPAYWRLDARLGWRLADSLEFDVVGQNLTDDWHREWNLATDANATRIGRAIYGKLVWRR
jgi:iron complex outermembrane receptor protein